MIMLKIWGRPSSVNVQKVLWTVRELALPHTAVHVGGQFGGLDTPEYGKMNPNRKVPVIDDGGLVLWESNRSEEHTSELQSLMRISYAVFCLKKKNNTRKIHYHT